MKNRILKTLCTVAILAAVLLPGCSIDESVFGSVRFIDENDTPYGIREVDNKPLLSSSSYYLDVALGNIPTSEIVHKFGRNPDIDTTSDPETIWMTGGLYTWQTAAQTLTVVSTSVNDDGNPTTSTGAQTLTIIGLDANFDELTDTIILDGTTPVVTTELFLRVNRAYVATSGTYHATNLGDITAIFTATTNGAFTIPTGVGQTELGFYTIPNGKVGSILGFNITMDSGKSIDIALQKYLNADDIIQPFGGADRVVIYLAGIAVPYVQVLATPISFPAKTDLEWVVNVVLANNTSVSVFFELLVEDV